MEYTAETLIGWGHYYLCKQGRLVSVLVVDGANLNNTEDWYSVKWLEWNFTFDPFRTPR
jgi:hypothetical protein